ncbi:MAG: hypothetical protein LBL65_05630 [Campylobacteraceae bacterium]|jgi:hypothetical protein|nr:hypothetical protein [Campylobacteraceae bacterium]
MITQEHSGYGNNTVDNSQINYDYEIGNSITSNYVDSRVANFKQDNNCCNNTYITNNITNIQINIKNVIVITGSLLCAYIVKSVFDNIILPRLCNR